MYVNQTSAWWCVFDVITRVYNTVPENNYNIYVVALELKSDVMEFKYRHKWLSEVKIKKAAEKENNKLTKIWHFFKKLARWLWLLLSVLCLNWNRFFLLKTIWGAQWDRAVSLDLPCSWLIKPGRASWILRIWSKTLPRNCRYDICEHLSNYFNNQVLWLDLVGRRGLCVHSHRNVLFAMLHRYHCFFHLLWCTYSQFG